MKHILATVAAVLMALGAATPVLAQQTRVFEAELHHFSPPAGPCVNGVCEFESRGYGFTNLMGSVTVTAEGTWDFTTTPCSTLDPIEFTLVGATGSITISGSGVVCNGPSPSGFPQFFFGEGEITSGTGAFSGASGSVSIEGAIAGIGPVVHLSGSVSY